MVPKRSPLWGIWAFYLAMAFLLSSLIGCAEVQIRTLPSPPPTAKLRAFIKPITAELGDFGPWDIPHEQFENNVHQLSRRILQIQGIYEVVPREDVQSVLGGKRGFSRHDWSKRNWALAREVGRALHADYALFVERSRYRGIVFWDLVMIGLESGKQFRSLVQIPITPGTDYPKLFTAVYRNIFWEAKGDMLATAIRKSRAFSLEGNDPAKSEPKEIKEAPAPSSSGMTMSPAKEKPSVGGPTSAPSPTPMTSAPVAKTLPEPASKETKLPPQPSPVPEVISSLPPSPVSKPPSLQVDKVPSVEKPTPSAPVERKEPMEPKAPPASLPVKEVKGPEPMKASSRGEPPLLRPSPHSLAKTLPPEKASPASPKLMEEAPEGLLGAKVLDLEKILAAEAKPDGRRRLAVYDLEASEALKVIALILSEALREELVRLGQFDLVNRENLVQVLKEIDLQMTGLVDEKQAVQVGKGLAANQIVMGRFGALGKTSILQAKRVDVENQRTLTLESLKCTQGQEDELLTQMPELARRLAGLP